MRKLEFQDRLEILLKMRLSGVAEQGYENVVWEIPVPLISLSTVG